MYLSVIARSAAKKQSSWFAAVGCASVAMTASKKSQRAFTLVLLIVIASLVTTRMSSFFRGRALNHEARRMLSLISYGQSRAIAEGVPVVLWIDPGKSTYGLEIQSGYTTGDDHAADYEAEPSITLETPAKADTPESESDDVLLGMPENLPAIRFTPDGFIDEVSVPKIVLRQGEESALEIGQTPNRLRYEIRPVTNAR